MQVRMGGRHYRDKADAGDVEEDGPDRDTLSEMREVRPAHKHALERQEKMVPDEEGLRLRPAK